MESIGVPAAAQSAAVLGSRSARRQLRAVLADAAAIGAYSVGFATARGVLTGFTVYFSGDFAGAGGGKAAFPATARARVSLGRAERGQGAGRAPSAAAFRAAQPPDEGRAGFAAADAQQGSAHDEDAPRKAAPVRRRGCRAGKRKQRKSACGHVYPIPSCSPCAGDSAPHAAAPPPSPPPPPPPPPAPPAPSSPSVHSLSALAPVFTPRKRSIAMCGRTAPKVSRQERHARERSQYERDLRYDRERAHDMRDRSPSCRPRVHVPLGIMDRSIDGTARYMERRTKLYYRNLRAEGFEVSDSE